MKQLICLVTFAVAFQFSGCDKSPSSASPIAASKEAGKPTSPAKLTIEDEFALILKNAEAQDANAQYEVSKRYRSGTGVEKNIKQSLNWLKSAASSGKADAQVDLGQIYEYGKDGEPKDVDEAFRLYEAAAASGNVTGMYYSGLAYSKGSGTKADKTKALALITKAANAGSSLAQNKLGHAYLFGNLGVKRDEKKAIEWFEQVAAQNDPEQLENVGFVYWHLLNEPKIREGYDLTVRAANLGSVKSQSRLCVGIDRYKSLTSEREKKLGWCTKAAEAGDLDALVEIAQMYRSGTGLPKSDAKAAEYFLSAAKQGSAPGKLGLGILYSSSDEVGRDYVLAYAWLNLAASSTDSVDEISEVPVAARQIRNLVEKKLTKTELVEARNISASWKIGDSLSRDSVQSELFESGGKLKKAGTGTAFFVSSSGHAITNHHVVNGCKEVRIEGGSNTTKVVTSDVINDLSLLLITGGKNSLATIAEDPGKLRQGEDVVVFGFPLNAVLSSGGNLTLGVVSATTGLGNNTNQIQITAPIQPGSSGSPVMSKRGEVVAVVSMKLSDSKMARATGSVAQNANFAVSGQTLKSFLIANQVAFKTPGVLSFNKSNVDIAEDARKWTTVVECWK